MIPVSIAFGKKTLGLCCFSALVPALAVHDDSQWFFTHMEVLDGVALRRLFIRWRALGQRAANERHEESAWLTTYG